MATEPEFEFSRDRLLESLQKIGANEPVSADDARYLVDCIAKALANPPAETPPAGALPAADPEPVMDADLLSKAAETVAMDPDLIAMAAESIPGEAGIFDQYMPMESIAHTVDRMPPPAAPRPVKRVLPVVPLPVKPFEKPKPVPLQKHEAPARALPNSSDTMPIINSQIIALRNPQFKGVSRKQAHELQVATRKGASKRIRRWTQGALLVSLVAHVAFGVVAGFVIAFRALNRAPAPMFQADNSVRPSLKPRELIMKVNVQDLQKASSRPKLMPRLAANAASDLPLPKIKKPPKKVKNQVKRVFSVTPSHSFGRGLFGDGFGDGGGNGGGMFFGVKTRGSTGLIMDVSKSTRPYVLLVVRELDANFRNAPLVCVISGGISPLNVSTTKVVPADKVREMSRQFPGQNMYFHLEVNGSPRESIKQLAAQLEKRPATYGTVGVPATGSQIGDTHLAIERFMQLGLKNIHIFSDFAEPLDPGITSKLTQQLVAKKVRVNAWVLGSKRQGPLDELVNTTGGKFYFNQIPKAW